MPPPALAGRRLPPPVPGLPRRLLPQETAGHVPASLLRPGRLPPQEAADNMPVAVLRPGRLLPQAVPARATDVLAAVLVVRPALRSPVPRGPCATPTLPVRQAVTAPAE